MPVKFSLKSSFFSFLGGLACAAGIAFLVNFILAGPKLGPHYDILLTRFKKPVVSKEILTINADEFIENGDILSILMTLIEMDASDLIFAGRISPSASPIIVTEAEIRRRFIDEYLLLGANIRNLFDAIRLGSVSPLQAPVYIERLVELTEQGRDRLLASLVEKDENLLRSASAFGSYLEVDTPPLFDKDGKIRRVQPVNGESSVEHPVLLSLKQRYADIQVETIGKYKVLWFLRHDGTEFDIPMDSNGNIITPWNCGFRSIDIALFRRYDEADRAMRAALTQAGELGAFSKTLPEQSPLFIGEYALTLKEEMLKSPDVEKRAQWINMRSRYFSSLDEFLNGQAENILISGYDGLISGEASLREEGAAALRWMRDEMIKSFDVMRNEYAVLTEIRARLEEELPLSFCVLGSGDNAQYSALLANTLITGSHILPVYDNYAVLFSIAASFIILLTIFVMRPALALILGSFLSVLAGAAFGFVFIFYSWWIDPVIVISSSFAGALCIFFCKRAILKYRHRRFRLAYGAAVSKAVLRNLIFSGRPRLSDVIIAPAAVVAIKDINLLKREDREKPQDAGSLKKTFYTTVKDAVNGAGAVIAGYEGDTVLACFGSPLDNCANHVYRACAFVKELLGNEKINWRFGIDAGECSFFWSPETGYSANGCPAVRARVLVSKTVRLQVRALITYFIKERINADAKKTDSLFDDSEPIFDFSSCAAIGGANSSANSAADETVSKAGSSA